MGKKKPAPPPAPDYAAAATAQGQANQQAGLQSASLSNPNVYNPYGSQEVRWDATGPNGQMQPTIYQTLNPNAQAALDSQQNVQLQQANLAQQGMTQASGILSQPFQYQGPGIQTSFGGYSPAQTSFDYQNAQTDLPDYGLAQNFGDYQKAQTTLGDYGQVQQGLDLSGLAKMPVNAGTTGQQALLARLNPQMQQQDNAFAQQLANQGITAGGEAYDNAMRGHLQGNNDLVSQAGLYGLGLDMQANQQGYNQALQSGQFGNAAQLQRYNEALGAGNFANAGIAQNFAQQGAAGQFNNAALGQNNQQAINRGNFYNAGIGQNYSQNMGAAGLYNQGMAQNYNQGLGAAQFGNSAVAQSLQHQLALRNQPLNEISGLMSGSQIQAPQFQQYTGANIDAAPIANATSQLGQYQQGIYGQQMAGYNADMSALGSIVGGVAGIGMAPMTGGGSLFGNFLQKHT